MGNYLIVKTKVEDPDVQMYQGELDTLKLQLRTEPDVWDLKAKVYAIAPDPNQSRGIRGAFRLLCVSSDHVQSAAEAHLQEALYYARIDGNKPESEVLGQFLKLVHSHYTEAKERETRVAAPPKLQEVPNVQTTGG